MFPEIDTGRRPRRRRFVIPLVLTLVVAGAWWVGSLAQDELTVAAYLDEARTISDAQAPRAETFRRLLIDTSAQNMERAAFSATLDQIKAGIDADIAALGELEEVPEDAFTTNVFLELALERWSSGITDLRESALRLPDGADLAARSDVSEALVSMQVADAMYEQFQFEAATLTSDLGMSIAPFVDVEFVEPSFSTPEGVDQFIQAILDNPAMAAAQDLQIVSVGFEPVPLGEKTPEGLEQIPATETVTVTVVVRNDGTDPEEGLEVRLRLATREGAVLVTETSSIGSLGAAGASTAVEFGGIEVTDGISYRMDVELARAGGGTIDADTIEFVVSPPSG